MRSTRFRGALEGVLHNLPSRVAARAVRPLVFPLGRRYRLPSDAVGAQVARGLLEDRNARLSLTADMYVPPPDEPGLGRLEAALRDAVAAHRVETKIRDAVRAGQLDKAPGDALLEAALASGIVLREEYEQVLQADQVRDEVIQVDAFPTGGMMADFRTLKEQNARILEVLEKHEEVHGPQE